MKIDLVLESSDSCINVEFESFQTLKGEGLPEGGLPNQILKKKTEKNYDYYWADEEFSSIGEYPNVVVGKSIVAEFDTKGNNISETFAQNIERLNDVESLAKGAQQSISFGDYFSMVNVFNALPLGTYNVGQNIMIVTLYVPDLWISKIESKAFTFSYISDEDIVSQLKTNGFIRVGHYTLSALETQKVDLLQYYDKSETNSLLDGKLDKVTGVQYDSAYIVTAKGSQTMRTISSATSAWTLALRREGGALEVGTPSGNTDAVNLKYFNANVPKFTTTLKENGAYTLTITTPEAEV